jgi:putative transposase
MLPPMPSTYSNILLHLIFSTKNRRELITPEIEPRLHEYLGGAIRGEKGVCYAIGGMPDHLHMLLRWRTDATISDLMRNIKSGSTVWVKETCGQDFAWQTGYSVFSVSQSAKDDVASYILRQREHHEQRSFTDELEALLRLHGVEYDPRYIWD